MALNCARSQWVVPGITSVPAQRPCCERMQRAVSAALTGTTCGLKHLIPSKQASFRNQQTMLHVIQTTHLNPKIFVFSTKQNHFPPHINTFMWIGLLCCGWHPSVSHSCISFLFSLSFNGSFSLCPSVQRAHTRPSFFCAYCMGGFLWFVLSEKQLMPEITLCKAPPKQTSGGNQYNCMAQRKKHEAAAGRPGLPCVKHKESEMHLRLDHETLDCAGMFPK